MRILFRFFIGFWLIFFGGTIEATAQDQSKSEQFLSASFRTSDSDSILLLLDLAIKHANKEDNADVLVESLIEKGIVFEQGQQGDSSDFYFNQALSRAKNTELTPIINAKLHHQFGNHVGNQDEYFMALSHLDTAANLYLSVSDSGSYGDMLSLQGALHDNNGNQGKALRMYLKASKIYEATKDSAVFAGILNNVAIIYKKLGDIEGALEYYNKSIELGNQLNDTVGISISKLNRGMLYKDLSRFEEALSEVYYSLRTFKKEKMNRGAAIAHHNLSEIYLVMNKTDSVLYHIDASQAIAIDLQYWTVVVSNQIVLAKALKSMGRADISNKSALRAYNLAIEHGFLEKQEELTSLIALNYEELGDFELALDYYKKYKQVKDSLLGKESQEQINRLRTEYDLEQKEEDIKGLETINSYQKSLAEKEHKISQFLTVGIFLSLLVIALFFYLYRRQKDLSTILTDQKVQLTGLNKEKDDLIAMVAHDLRSPLNNIKGLLALIKDANGAEQEKMIELANESTDVLRTRINQILDVEAINVGKINLKIEKINVSDILTKLVHHITPEAEQKHISFYAHSVKNLKCMADQNYLLQVLENLCANAIKFSKQKSEIYVKVGTNKDKLRFEVQDQGQGIPKGEMKKLFERYAKISTLPTENEKSTGLGLPIVKKYVEAMGGKVWCESEVGVGSTFYFDLPAA
ncbi:ATP-binding protein [Reichenbachiella sp.]|uniref:ATP-binding protein n=1 Tax=Reichenbachiella sp. TaxID=2184521 RepID=UPI003BB12512